MGRKRARASIEEDNTPVPAGNVTYEIIDERPKRKAGSYNRNHKELSDTLRHNDERHWNREEMKSNNTYALRSCDKLARKESPMKLRIESPTRRSRRTESLTPEECFRSLSQDSRKGNIHEREGKGKETNEKNNENALGDGKKEEQQPRPDGEKGSEQSSEEAEVVEEEEEDSEELNHARYSLRRNRSQFSKTTQHRRPIRSCRLGTRSIHFVSGVRRKYKKNFDATVIQRLPSNPVLDGQKLTKYTKLRHRRRLDRCTSSSSSSSSSSTDEHSMRKDLENEAKFERRTLKSLLKGRQELMPINLSEKDIQMNMAQIAREKVRQTNSKSSCADIDPMQIELGNGFEQVGGLAQHIQSLKEIVLFPMLYPHLYERFNIQPPKGVLFYGAPGTGKTLVARALAQECGKSGAGKIAFFMRKGADCLSKWVGESERQLRLLFDQAFRMRPSIIFFDEIDGLAPVRSSRQDQIHSSIVSTLLALMDGLDSRGEVIVIGATNRLDSIDPALRRPGRFDRELSFDLPDANARRFILEIHTKQWGESRPDQALLHWLAEHTSGYCGADIKALCTESVLVAVRERFPHMYISSEKLDIVKRTHCFLGSSIHSQMPGHCCRIAFIDPLVEKLFSERIPSGYLNKQNLENLYETELERVVMALKVRPRVPNARILLHGQGRLGQTTHFLPVLVNRLDHLSVFSLSTETIFAGPGTPEEHISQMIGKALRTADQQGSAQALVLLPDLDLLETILPIGTWKLLVSSLGAFSGFLSVLLLGSVQQHYENCSEDIKRLFPSPNSLVEIFRPNRSAIKTYFDAILADARKQPTQFNPQSYPTPPKAKIEAVVRKFTTAECKEFATNLQQMLRQFRIFLRDLLRHLIREQRFKHFHLPVDKKDAEDYYEIIKQPMCLSQMMFNIDVGRYPSKNAFMEDIQLIRNNAIEYNPDTDMDSKQIRHAANALVDMAEALFSMEMDDDFPNKIEEARKLVEESMEVEAVSGEERGGREGEEVRGRDMPTMEEGTNGSGQSKQNERDWGKSAEQSPPPIFVLDMEGLRSVVLKATDKARICSWGVPQIECLGAELCQIVDQYSGEWDRSELSGKMTMCIDNCQL
uniref:Bromo domain-containing protein n=1 Tax=Globodera rostochiensis TaxID=31243 RepID=A0A914H4P0_GLORO